MSLRTWLLLAVIVAAAALRFTAIGEAPPGLYTDEAANGNDALHALETGDWQWFYPANNGREGLFINLQAIALGVTGEREPWVLRVVSAIAGTLAIPGMYVLGSAVWNRRAGLLAAALLAGSFWHVHFSRVGFRAILAVLVAVWAFGLLLEGLRKIRNGGRFGRALVIAGGALAGLGLHTYIGFRAMAVPLLVTGALAIWSARTKGEGARLFRTLVLAAAAALAVASPMLWYFGAHPGSFSGRASDVSILSGEQPGLTLAKNVALEVGMLVWRGDGNWRHNYPPAAALPLLLVPFFAYGAWSVTSRTWRTRGRELGDAAVLALFVAALLPAALSAEGMPHALRGILLVIPVVLATAFGLLRTWYRIEERGWSVAGAALAACVVVYATWHTAARYPAYATRYETRDEFTSHHVEVGRALRERDRGRDAYVIVRETDVLVGGIPTSAQTVMFMTGTGTPGAQQRERIFYVTDPNLVPEGAAAYDAR